MIPFEKSFASHPKSAFWSNKNLLTPTKVTKGTQKKFWFDCNKCCHEFYSRLNDITSSNSWCPYCANLKLCEKEDCKDCFEKSFASHPKNKFWSNNNESIPRYVFKNSHKIYLFNCTCDHEFKISLASIVKQDAWCTFCSKTPSTLCDNKNCDQCFNKSFASCEKYIYWSSKNKINPRKIFKNSQKKFWFDCNKCNHNFEKSIQNIIKKDNCWCPYCANKKLCEDNNCKMCFNNSFANNYKSNYWSIKNLLTPRNIFNNSHTKYLFDCNICNNEFIKSPNEISSCNSWCPICKNKTELKLFEWLKENKYNTKKESSFIWSKGRRYDFILQDLKLIIE